MLTRRLVSAVSAPVMPASLGAKAASTKTTRAGTPPRTRRPITCHMTTSWSQVTETFSSGGRLLQDIRRVRNRRQRRIASLRKASPAASRPPLARTSCRKPPSRT